ncbi:hypothetical protein [Aquimarina mytili]|uniref:Uncharacterized protein n=1 Tax=Aquimarina mytili TaxID=874423 RepID=A0A937D4N4_9FLAO|nr:hypothetical protein [Aquimarina mytili]MBL0682389.1 hypothetical protein [Aquimarina mytili]
MENKKLNLGKITITKLNNLYDIKGGQIMSPDVTTIVGPTMQTCAGHFTCTNNTETNPTSYGGFTEDGNP